ncbi:MAG: ABC transporter permease, partial [Longimicrobiales bacterium]
TGIVAGIVPAVAARRSLAQSLRDGTAAAGEGVRRQRLRATLVVAQVAVSFALVVSAGLMLKSLYALSAVPLGYDTERVMTANIYGNFSRMSSAQEALRIQYGVLERLRAAPSVNSAAITNAVPQSETQPSPRRIRIEGRQAADGRPFEADANVVSDGYFETLGVPLLAGRDVRETDTGDTPPVAVINRSMAAFWDGANPVGSRITADDDRTEPRWITVVGVVDDFRLYAVDRPVTAEVYIPLGQAGFAGRILVRTDADPGVAAATIRAAVHEVDREIPVEDIRSLAQLRNERLAAPRLTSALLSVFAAVALLVTLVGIGGLIGTSVSQRTRELGLRMALGATRRSVLELVLRQGLGLVGAGLLIGLLAALAFGRLIARFLFETTPADATVLAGVMVVFVAGALVAVLGPARRATAVDPLIALKVD